MSIIDVALAQRHAELRETFVQRKLDPSVEIQRFASGMLTYFDRENLTIDGNWWVQAGTAIDLVYVASAWPDSHFAEEPADIQGIGVLNEHPLDTSVYDVVECETEDDLSCGPALAAIAGTWNGFLYEDNLYPSRPMTTITFHAAPPNAELQKEDPNVYRFVSEGTDYDGAEYIVNGTCTTSEDGSTIEVKWCMEYDGDVTIWFVGCLLDQFTLSGDQRLTEHERSPGDSYLILKKAPTDYLCFRPAPFELQSQPHPLLYPISDVTPESRARALWRYALNAVQHDVRRKWWTWSYFEERRRVRRLWFDIRCRELDGPLDFRELHQRTTSADARVYFDATEYVNKEQNCYTTNWACEGPGCGRYLRITIVVCLECLSDDFRHAIAFCDNPKCYGTDDLLDRTLPNGLPPHRASHTLIKFRTTMLHAYWPSVKQRAFADLQQAMWLLSQSENVLPVQYSPGASSVLLPVDEAEGEAAPPPSTAQREDATGEDQYLSLNEENMKAEEYANPNPPCLSPPIKLSGEGTLSKWSLRSLLPSAWRKPLTGGPPASAADASSTLAPSHLNRSDSPDADATPGGDAPSHFSASPQGCRGGSVNEEQPPPQPTDLSRSRRSGPEGDGDDGAAHSDSDDGTSSKDVPSLYATAPPSFRSSSSRAVSLMIPPRYDVCSVCTAPVLMGCWFCMLCNVFICTACDAQRNIMCVTCGKPFPQPSWYYGMGPLDNFQCDVCCATRRPLPPSWDLARPHPHVHTHPVLLCKQPPPPQPDESEQGAPEPPPPPPVTSPLAALEGKIGEMGARLGQLDEVQGQLAQIQAMMARLLEQQGAAADSRST
ncbi:hypothetical protein BC628DRAFT_1386478 [Trametes gibbosa]|nr:hypothetical protein BC628DRAFT_1386478 [Trametes gibbosa]